MLFSRLETSSWAHKISRKVFTEVGKMDVNAGFRQTSIQQKDFSKVFFFLLLQTMLAMLWDHKNVTWHGFVSSTITLQFHIAIWFCNYLSTWNHIWYLYYWVFSIYSLKVFRDKLFEPKLMKAIASSLPTDISSGPWKLDGEIKMMQSSTFVENPQRPRYSQT